MKYYCIIENREKAKRRVCEEIRRKGICVKVKDGGKPEFLRRHG